MRSMMAVTMQPVGRHISDFLLGIKDIAVQHFGTVGPVEFLNIGILGWLPRLDVVEGNILELGPFGQCMGDEFRAVIQVNGSLCNPRLQQLIERSDDSGNR